MLFVWAIDFFFFFEPAVIIITNRNVEIDVWTKT